VLRVKVPVTDYEVKGYAASGSGLVEVGGGLFVGKAGLGTENLFAEAGYTFTWVQKEDGGGAATEAYGVHHSDASIQLGYLFTSRLNAGLGSEFRWTHGGVEAVDIDNVDPLVREWHDPILKRKYVAIAAAAGYALTDTVSVSALFSAVVWGDSVSDAKTIGVDVSWMLGPR
jgi:hypothetical protein